MIILHSRNEQEKMIEAIIFDFDGVLCESVDLKTRAFAEIYQPYGNDVQIKVVNHHSSNTGISRFEKFRFYHKKFLGIDLSNAELNNMADQFSKLVMQKVIEAPYVRGAYEFLSNYHSFYDFYVSTATPETEITQILERKNLNQFFKGVYGSPDSKNEHIKKIIKFNEYKPHHVVFIGDSFSDRQAAINNSIRFIARVVEEDSKLNDTKVKITDMFQLDEVIEKLPSLRKLD